jgi:hypothetical protein
MKVSGKILRHSLAAVFISIAANSGAKAEMEENNPLLEPFTPSQNDQKKTLEISFIYKDAAQHIPKDIPLNKKVKSWQDRQAQEPDFPKIEAKGHYTEAPEVKGENIGKDFNNVRAFITYLVEQDIEREAILNVIAAYADQFKDYYYKRDTPENDLIMRPDIYGQSDDWETLSEVILENGDDCDGLAMLSRQLMIDAGIPKEELFFQAFISSKQDVDLGHAVISWVDPAHPHDPLIIDSTSYISKWPYRLSAIDWPKYGLGAYYRFNESSFAVLAEIRANEPEKKVAMKNMAPAM